MFKKLLASTAIVALMAGGALAQGTPTEPREGIGVGHGFLRQI